MRLAWRRAPSRASRGVPTRVTAPPRIRFAPRARRPSRRRGLSTPVCFRGAPRGGLFGARDGFDERLGACQLAARRARARHEDVRRELRDACPCAAEEVIRPDARAAHAASSAAAAACVRPDGHAPCTPERPPPSAPRRRGARGRRARRRRRAYVVLSDPTRAYCSWPHENGPAPVVTTPIQQRWHVVFAFEVEHRRRAARARPPRSSRARAVSGDFGAGIREPLAVRRLDVRDETRSVCRAARRSQRVEALVRALNEPLHDGPERFREPQIDFRDLPRPAPSASRSAPASSDNGRRGMRRATPPRGARSTPQRHGHDDGVALENAVSRVRVVVGVVHVRNVTAHGNWRRRYSRSTSSSVSSSSGVSARASREDIGPRDRRLVWRQPGRDTRPRPVRPRRKSKGILVSDASRCRVSF